MRQSYHTDMPDADNIKDFEVLAEEGRQARLRFEQQTRSMRFLTDEHRKMRMR